MLTKQKVNQTVNNGGVYLGPRYNMLNKCTLPALLLLTHLFKDFTRLSNKILNGLKRKQKTMYLLIYLDGPVLPVQHVNTLEV